MCMSRGRNRALPRPPPRRRANPLSLFQARDHQVQDVIRHLALGHLLELVPRAVAEEDDPRVVIAPKARILPRDVVGDDRVKSLAVHLLHGLLGQVRTLSPESTANSSRRFPFST